MRSRYSPWKTGLLFVILVISTLYALPNLYGEAPAVQISPKTGRHLSANAAERIVSVLNQAHIQHHGVIEQDPGLQVRFDDTDQQLKARDLLRKNLNDNAIVALNLASRTPDWLRNLGALPMKLGLDLRGGIHFLLDVDVDSLLKTRQQGDIRTIKAALRDKKIRYTQISPNATGLKLRFRDQANLQQAQSLLAQKFFDYHQHVVKNAAQPSLQIQLTEAATLQMTDYAIEQTITILTNRVNELGVSEAAVQRQGRRHISIDLPGIQDPARAKELLGKTATLFFHLVDDKHDPATVAATGLPPTGDSLNYDEAGRPVLLETTPILTGSSITYASAVIRDGRPAVNIHLGGGDESLFHRKTAESVGKPLAVMYVETELKRSQHDKKAIIQRIRHQRVISVATIQSPLGNNFDITGLPSQAYAENLALLLRSGALAAPVDIIQETTVGPSLGKANINMGILSLEIGSLLVIIFMTVYYRLFGLVANAALMFNVLLIIAVLSMLGATLTLPGIAGIVLTVGMAVDANVLINERIREELRNGLSPLASISAGYDRAFSTIVDANVTTLIVALILFSLGSGSVKGFAVTLTIGILASMLTSIFFTRAIISLIYGHKQPQKLSIGV